MHGPERGSRPGGCRCELCRAASSEAQREARLNPVPAYVSATPARAHVEFLSQHGVGLKQIAKVSGVAHGALWKLMYGPSGRGPSKRIRPATAEKILAVTPADAADGARVPAGPTWEKVDQLVAAGLPKTEIARRIGQNSGGLQLGREFVSGGHARTIAALHARWLAGELTWVRRGRHGSRTVTLPPPDASDDLGVPVAPVVDDADELLIEFVEILENRIDHAGWRASAACRGVEPWLFFPVRGDAPTARAAKRVCASCVVRQQCLDAHLDEQHGVYGGTFPKERRGLRKEVAA